MSSLLALAASRSQAICPCRAAFRYGRAKGGPRDDKGRRALAALKVGGPFHMCDDNLEALEQKQSPHCDGGFFSRTRFLGREGSLLLAITPLPPRVIAHAQTLP